MKGNQGGGDGRIISSRSNKQLDKTVYNNKAQQSNRMMIFIIIISDNNEEIAAKRMMQQIDKGGNCVCVCVCGTCLQVVVSLFVLFVVSVVYIQKIYA